MKIERWEADGDVYVSVHEDGMIGLDAVIVRKSAVLGEVFIEWSKGVRGAAEAAAVAAALTEAVRIARELEAGTPPDAERDVPRPPLPTLNGFTMGDNVRVAGAFAGRIVDIMESGVLHVEFPDGSWAEVRSEDATKLPNAALRDADAGARRRDAGEG